MECIFAGFDYAILYPDGSQKIIERNDNTSFLTKKLRHFGGTGEYLGKKIGILMRDIMFTGKGITDNPANDASVIFSRDSLAFASQIYAKSEDIFGKENVLEYISSDNGEEQMKLEEALVKISELEAALVSKNAELVEAGKFKGEAESTKVELANVKTELTSASDKLSKVEQNYNESKLALETANKAVDEGKTKLVSAEAEVNVLKAEKRKIERVEKIKEVLSLPKEDAELNFTITATLSNDTFNSWLENTKKMLDSKLAKNKDAELEIAKAKKDLEDTNKKLAEDQLKDVKKGETNLGTASVVAEDVDAQNSKALASVFTKKVKKD